MDFEREGEQMGKSGDKRSAQRVRRTKKHCTLRQRSMRVGSEMRNARLECVLRFTRLHWPRITRTRLLIIRVRLKD